MTRVGTDPAGLCDGERKLELRGVGMMLDVGVKLWVSCEYFEWIMVT